MTRRRLAGLPALAVLAVLTGCGPDLEEYRPVLDLVAALPLAEVHREVGEIDLGTPYAAQHLLWGWSWNEREPAGDGGVTTYTWGLGGSSGLRLFLVTRRDLRLELRARPGPPVSEGPQGVTFQVNGDTVDEVTLEPRDAGWVTYSVAVPREVLAAGWNTVALDYRHAVEPREAGVSGDRRELAVAWDRIRVEPAGSADGARPEAVEPQTLRLPLGAEVAYHAAFPAGSVLAFDGLRASGVESRLLVRLQWEGGEPVDLVSLQESRRRRVLELPGGAVAGGEGEARPARLSLRAVPAGWLEARDATTDGTVEIVAPRVLAPGEPAPAEDGPATAPAASGSAAADRRPDVLVYLIDALRTDRVGAYEPAAAERNLTPEIDAFARGAVVFEDALTQAPWTRPAVTSLFTGLPPLAHGVTTLESRLPAPAVTVAEILRDLPGGGYRTAAWSTNAHVTRNTGLAQGFEDFHFLPRQPGPDRVNRRVIAWLDRHLEEAAREPPGERRRPFFLYVHALDPHAPYRPPPGLWRRFAPEVDDPTVGTLGYLRRVYGTWGAERAELLAPLPALYDAEVALADRGFGELLRQLEARRLRDDMLVVLLADHGEELDEHGHLGHANDLYQETLRIPLIVDLPGGEPGRAAGTALPMDVAATVLAALGVPRPPGMAGMDLLAAEPARAARPAFAHLDYEGRAAVSVVLGEWKLIEPLSARFGRGPELYHLGRDPEEREDLAESRPVRTGYLRTLVRRHLLENGGDAGAGERLEIDPKIREELEALGYL